MISVIVPIFNEKENINSLVHELKAALADITSDFEIIAVDDGSKDGSFNELKSQALLFKELRVVRLSRNYGQTAALYAGIEKSRGEIIVTIDSDLENDPKDIKKLIDVLNNGYDLVCGWRQGRWKEKKLSRKLPSIIANYLISRIGGVPLHDYGCTLKAYKREAISNIPLYGEMHRFIPIYVSRNGAKITEVPVNYRPRKFGVSKYGISRTFRVILDLFFIKFMTSYMNRPIHFFGGIGFVSLAIGVIAGLSAVVLKVAGIRTFVATPLPILSALFLIVSIQLIVIGILAEILMRTYYESQHKTPFRIKESINFDASITLTSPKDRVEERV